MEFGQGVDYSQYASWPKVVAPSGQVYYKVPGTGYLFDPFLSSAKGRPVLFSDPTAQAAEVQKAKDKQNQLIEQEEFNRSPTGQLLPVAGSIAGAIGANEIFKLGVGTPPPTVQGVLPNGNIIFTDGTIKTAGGEIVNSGATQAANQTFSSAASEGATGIVGPPAPAVPATPTGLEVGPATPVTQSAAAMGPTPFYVPAAVAAGTYLAGKSAYDLIKGKEEDKSAQGKFGRGQLAFTTMGLSEVARALGLGGQKSTKQIQQERRDELIGKNITGYESYLSTAGTPQGGTAPTDQGFEASRDEKLLTPEQIWGSEAMFETYGNDWLGKLNETQRRDISSRLIQDGLIQEKKGGIYITDEAKAKQIKDQVLTGFQIGTQSPQAQAAAQGAMAIQRPVVNKTNFVRR